MSTNTINPSNRKNVSESAVVGRIVLGAIGGAAAAMLVAGVAFDSWVVGLFAALAGAIGGMLGPARAAEEE